MAARSSIEWTDATWNPVTGCSKVSQWCSFCYAERFSYRLQARGNPEYRDEFNVTPHPGTLEEPRHWREPRRRSRLHLATPPGSGETLHPEVPEAILA